MRWSLAATWAAWSVFILIGSVSAGTVEEYEEADSKALYIPPADFDKTISEGQWLVFFGSKTCPHCRAFTPTWVQVQQEVLPNHPGFYMGKVECTGRAVNEDLCEANKVKFYPTVKLFHNGKLIEEAEDIRDVAKLSRYVEKASRVKVDHTIKELNSLADAATKPRSGINPDGVPIHLTDKTFAIMTNNTPWFVMFHAPWCSHCQKLKPVFLDLAPAVKGRVNIGLVNCDIETKTCKEFGIRGYPTLKFLQLPDTQIDYKSARTHDQLRDFALSFSSKPAFAAVKASELPDIFKANENVFVFVQDPESKDEKALDAFIQIANIVRTDAPFYITPDPEARKLLKVPGVQHHLIAVKDHGAKFVTYQQPLVADSALVPYIRQFVLDNRYPRIVHLDSGNQEEILGGEKVVVLAVIDPADSRRSSIMKKLTALSIAWDKKEADENLHNVVTFAWLDGVKWRQYVERVYGLHPKDFPVVIVADPKEDTYYTTDKSGKALDFEENMLVQALDEILEGQGLAQTTSGFVSRSLRVVGKGVAGAVDMVMRHMFLFLTFLFIAVIVYYYELVPGRGSHGLAKAE
ncbi:thioredoxin-like protein [Gaertneriomyces semiglobifer]|nr:thioredoxin-like protein [Gaertneriomyces semiglobifer]